MTEKARANSHFFRREFPFLSGARNSEGHYYYMIYYKQHIHRGTVAKYMETGSVVQTELILGGYGGLH